MNTVNRRRWLFQSTAAMAALALGKPTFAAGSSPYDNGDNGYEVDSPIVRIGQNENPYGPSPKAVQAMMNAVAGSNRYPADLTDNLRSRIARQFGLTKEHVLLGAGSSELLAITAAYSANGKGNLVTAHPTFKLWFTAAENFGLSLKKIPLTADKVHDLPNMLAAIDDKTKLVYVVNPHNPTGTVVGAAALENFVTKASATAVVLLDEAYTEYSDEPSLAAMVSQNKNLVIAKTFSKIYGMAGVRVGFALAHPDTIKKLASWTPWANSSPSNMALAGALAAMDDTTFLGACRSKNDTVKTYVMSELNTLGYRTIPSHTNFFYYDISPFKGDLIAKLSDANIRGVRVFEEDTNWRRTSLGTMEQMQQFIKVLKG